METSLGDSMFYTFQAFTGHSNLDPISSPNRLLLISLLFWVLIIITAYTANLTVFLVNRNYIVTVNDFEDVIHHNFPVCLWRGKFLLILLIPCTALSYLQFTGGGPETQLQEVYPNVNYVPKESELEIFQAVENGECEIGLISISSFKSHIKRKEYNPNCNIEWVGRQVQTNGASFTVGDSPYLCSSLLRDVLDIYLLDMIKDKSLDKIMESQQEVSTINCAKKQSGDSEQLSGKDIGGIFIVHFIILAIAALIAFWQLKNPRAISKIDNLSEQTKNMTRRLSESVLNIKKIDEFEEEINDETSSNSEANVWEACAQDEETKGNLLSEENMERFSFVSRQDHEELKKDVKEMKEMIVKLLVKSEKQHKA